MREHRIGLIGAIENEDVREGPVPAFLTAEETEAAWAFHHALDGYAPTPLVRLDGLARKLGVRAVFVKDESHRFGLDAFTGLGRWGLIPPGSGWRTSRPRRTGRRWTG